MKKVFVLILVLIAISCVSASAKNGALGLGVIVGEPTGISMKLWSSSRTAIDGAVAWSFEKHSKFQIHGDFLIHKYGKVSVEKGSLPLYYGIGGRIKTWNDNRDDNVGVRFPVGLEYLFANAPIDIFLEVVPILDLAPSTDLELNAAIGFRYFF